MWHEVKSLQFYLGQSGNSIITTACLLKSICKESSKNVVDLREANQGNCQLTFSFFLCFSITGISNLFTNEPNDRKFVHNPPISEANWFRMIVNLIN